MSFSYQSIPLDSINFTPSWNLHPWEFSVIPPELQENLTLNGVIHPPLVIADSAETFAIVCGAKRIEFVRKCSGSSHVDCLVVAKETPLNSILHLILADQSCVSPLSLAEKARFIQIASQFLKMEDIATLFKSKLQVKNGRSALQDLLKILQQDEQIINEIHAGRLQERMVAEILSLPEESDRLTLVQLFKNMGMGDGKQKKFFSLIRDIAFRKGSSITAFLQKKDIRAILDHAEMNIPQQIHHLGSLLQQEINPSSSLAEEVFAQQVKTLRLPEKYQVSHSPSFEKDEIIVSITFKNFAECQQYLHQKLEPIH
jgi:hypothetical protein